MGPSCICVILSLLAFVSYCNARPDGLPLSACSDLRPIHRDRGGGTVQAQRTRSPYTIQADKNGDRVRIRIFSTHSEDFQGFALQARSNGNKNMMINGEFTVDSGKSKAIDCPGGVKNTLTHIDNSDKREIVTYWTPSDVFNGNVIFRATILKNYASFWTEVDSISITVENTVSRTGAGSRQSQKSETGNDMYSDCFVTKGCFGLPAGCEKNGNCQVLLTYTNSEQGVDFKMSGMLPQQNYMAMGLSTDTDMGDDSVTECVRQDGSGVLARQSWNLRRGNQRIRELSRDRYNGSFTDGLASCSWTTSYQTQVNGRTFDLANSNYHILLARGPLDVSGNLEYHSGGRVQSGEPVNFTAFQAINVAGLGDPEKIHGTFMVTAWVGFVSLGILLARHFKTAWETKTLCGVKIWFALHRGFMIGGLCLAIVAFIVIFVHKKGWSYSNHAILGCIATALGLLQPIMAAFRPAPDHAKRPIFNWLHFLVGNFAHLFAVITIFYAKPLSGLDKNFNWTMSIFVIVHLMVHLVYQVHTWIAGRKKNNEVKMMEMNGSRVNGNDNNAPEKRLADNVFRILLLGIYAIFLVVILLTLYVLIGSL